MSSIPLTHRGVADSIHILSGRGADGVFPIIPAFGDKKSIVLLMALKRISKLSEMFINANYPPSFPTAVISKIGWKFEDGSEKMVVGCLSNIAALVENENIESPAIWIIGNCVSKYFI
jgi:siroheme synthase